MLKDSPSVDFHFGQSLYQMVAVPALMVVGSLNCLEQKPGPVEGHCQHMEDGSTPHIKVRDFAVDHHSVAQYGNYRQ